MTSHGFDTVITAGVRLERLSAYGGGEKIDDAGIKSIDAEFLQQIFQIPHEGRHSQRFGPTLGLAQATKIK